VSPGVVRLVFNNNYTVSVYKDGQYLYKVPVYVGSWYSSGPWAPAQKLVIPVYWGPNGIAIGVAPFVHIKNSVGYGAGLTYVYGTQTAAMPFYYRYNLTGAYPYRLDVQITTAEKKIAEADGWIYINVTYSGYLKLYLGDQLVAYDALYGWTIRREPGAAAQPTWRSATRRDVRPAEGHEAEGSGAQKPPTGRKRLLGGGSQEVRSARVRMRRRPQIHRNHLRRRLHDNWHQLPRKRSQQPSLRVPMRTK
jgi:hypothetical protein